MESEDEGLKFVRHKKFQDESSVWCRFLTSTDSKSAQCNICSAILKTLGGSTKGLHTHLLSKHGLKLEKAQTKTKPEASSAKRPLSPGPSTFETATKRTIKDYFQPKSQEDTLVDVLSRMTALDGLPFNIFIKSEDMRNLLLSKGYSQLPTSATTVRNLVVGHSKEIRSNLTAEIQQCKVNGDRFSLTFDEWTSNSNKRYMNINVHSSDQFWSLGLLRVHGSMKAEDCVSLLQERLGAHGLSLENDIVAIVTDGPNVMKKVGKLLPVKHQLCFAHAIHLAVCDVLYKAGNEADESEETFDDVDDDDLENVDSSEANLTIDTDSVRGDREAAELTSRYNISEVVKKVRKIVAYFRRSPTKNDVVLQKYVKAEKGKELSLILDVRTRWNSLLSMLERFFLLKYCIQKSLIDLKFQVKLEDSDFEVIKQVIEVLTPIKLTVEALCRQDSNLCTSDAALKFVVKQLSQKNSCLSNQMMACLIVRLKERRSEVLTGILNYLQNPELNDETDDFDGLFAAPSPASIRKEIKALIERLGGETQNVIDVTEEEEDEGTTDTGTTDTGDTGPANLKLMLEKEIEKSKILKEPKINKNDLMTTIKREMSLFESGGSRGCHLTMVRNFLLTIPPTSVEAERAFSAAGFIQNKLRCRLGDETLDCLLFLRAYYLKKKNKR